MPARPDDVPKLIAKREGSDECCVESIDFPKSPVETLRDRARGIKIHVVSFGDSFAQSDPLSVQQDNCHSI